ncbi:MAG: TraR/DksA family transcriptional regulator [Gammaproteobacteria bacterium]|nr:TraR/DksA family transcriptional regulator [Gammaproteobacteria bacterium]
MEKEGIEEFKARLLCLRSELEETKKSSREDGDTVELDQSRVGRLSRMDAMQSQQMALETARRCQQRLTKIEGALRRIDSGDYGSCFVCGDPIDRRRLEADPTSTRCMGCIEE